MAIDPLDWNQLKAFLETAETGSLSAAARKLGLTQPTLSRQVAAIEARLGVTLFERVGKAMALTGTGLALLDHARAMGAAAADLQLAATGQSQAVDGVVCISATDMVAAHLLPPLLARLREEAPGIVIEIVTSDALSARPENTISSSITIAGPGTDGPSGLRPMRCLPPAAFSAVVAPASVSDPSSTPSTYR